MADLYLAVSTSILALAFCFPAEPPPSTPAGATAAAFMGVAVCLAVLTIFVRMAPPDGGARAVGVLPLGHGMMVTLEKLLVSAGMAAAAASVAIRICATTTY